MGKPNQDKKMTFSYNRGPNMLTDISAFYCKL